MCEGCGTRRKFRPDLVRTVEGAMVWSGTGVFYTAWQCIVNFGLEFQILAHEKVLQIPSYLWPCFALLVQRSDRGVTTGIMGRAKDG